MPVPHRLTPVVIALLGAALVPAAPAHADLDSTAATLCELQAVIQFDPPGLTMNSAAFSYNIVGELSSSAGAGTAACASTVGGAPAGTSTFDAGNAYSVTVSGSGWSVTYALAQATGVGSCASSTTEGVVVSDWADGTHTVIDYSTVAVGTAWVLGGSVAKAATLHEVSSTGTPPAGTPATLTVKSNNASFPVGEHVAGALGFVNEIADPTCAGTSFGGLTGAVAFTAS
jgi:hypothetical protein